MARVVSRHLASGQTWLVIKNPMVMVYWWQSRYIWKKHKSQALVLLDDPQSHATNSALGEDSETGTGEEKKGLVWDCKEMLELTKSHSVMRARNKSYSWDLWEVERTVHCTGQEKKWGIRRKISLGVRDACLMSHWGYWGCMCPWQCHEYIRRVKRGSHLSRYLAQPQKHAVQGSVCNPVVLVKRMITRVYHNCFFWPWILLTQWPFLFSFTFSSFCGESNYCSRCHFFLTFI